MEHSLHWNAIKMNASSIPNRIVTENNSINGSEHLIDTPLCTKQIHARTKAMAKYCDKNRSKWKMHISFHCRLHDVKPNVCHFCRSRCVMLSTTCASNTRKQLALPLLSVSEMRAMCVCVCVWNAMMHCEDEYNVAVGDKSDNNTINYSHTSHNNNEKKIWTNIQTSKQPDPRVLLAIFSMIFI